MSRILFQRPDAGYCSATGDLIRRFQAALKDIGFSPGLLDGEFGGLTQAAVTRWQIATQLPPTGKVDELAWTTVTKQPIPSVKERCLQITASYEGTGFTKVVGNFDGAGITWGIIGFTLKYGELAALFRQVDAVGPELISDAFGDKKKQLFDVFNLPWDQQLDWANSISLGKTRYVVSPEWAEPFATFGSNALVQQIQLDRIEKSYWTLVQGDLAQLRKNSTLPYNQELTIALLFDTAVQDGGMGPERHALYRRRLELSFTTVERDARQILAQVIADLSNKSSRLDVLSRKQALASGEGTVHGSKYQLLNWALGDYVINPSENL